MIEKLLFWQPVEQSSNLVLFFFSHWFLWVLIFGLTLYWIYRKKIKTISFFWLLLVISEVVHTFLKNLSPWDRPFVNDGVSPPSWFVDYKSGSFPSGHAFRSVILMFFLWKEDKKVFWLLLLPVLLISVGRVVYKLHYPIDILGGFFLGVLEVYIFSKLAKI